MQLLLVPGDGLRGRCDHLYSVYSEDKGVKRRKRNQCCQGHPEGECVCWLLLLATSVDYTH